VHFGTKSMPEEEAPHFYARAQLPTTHTQREHRNVGSVFVTRDDVSRLSDEVVVQPIPKVLLGESVDDDDGTHRRHDDGVAR